MINEAEPKGYPDFYVGMIMLAVIISLLISFVRWLL